MLDFPDMLQVKLLVVGRVQPQSNKLAMGEENKATVCSKLYDNPGLKVGLNVVIVTELIFLEQSCRSF